MIRDDVRHPARFYWTPRLAALLVTLFPLTIHKVDFRGTFGGLSVSAYKASPAYAAFEDINKDYNPPDRNWPKESELLTAGEKFVPFKMDSGYRMIRMAGLTIRKQEADSPQPFYVAGQTEFKTRSAPSLSLTDSKGNLLPLAQRKEILAQQLARERESFETPAARAKKLVQEAILKPDQKVIPSVTGTKIIVAKADNHKEEPPPVEEPVEDTSPNPIASVMSFRPNPDAMRPLWLQGHVEMTGGLAFIGPESEIVVKRVLNGETHEKGKIWVSEGRFEIYVKSALGQLVAELTTRDGRVLGRGELNLVQLQTIPTKDNRIADIRLALRPTAEGANFRAISGYSHGEHKIPVRTAKVEIENFTKPQKVNDEGFYNNSALSARSSFVARATAPKHWASLVVGHTDQSQDIRLFSNKLVDALINLESPTMTDRKEAAQAAVVWGQVRRNGKVLAGVSVEMAGDYKPVYFNELYLPDSSLKTTSNNGLFAFVNVRAGVQALRVRANNRIYPAQIFPTEKKHVSYVDIELEENNVTHFKVVDLLGSAQIPEARIRLVGTDDIVSIQNEGLVQYANGANPFMVEAEAGYEYEVTRMTLTGRPQNLIVPVIRRDWLANLFNQHNIMALPGRGIVVGFVDDQDYEVEMTGLAPNEPLQIVFFDAQGAVVESRHGIAGGGFVIFNAPKGLQTVYIHPLNSKNSHAQIVVAEPEYVQVLTWSAGL